MKAAGNHAFKAGIGGARLARTLGWVLSLAAATGAVASATIDTPVIEGVQVNQTVEHYTVSGVTSRRLLEEMRALGPHQGASGRRSFGHTWAELSWSFGTTSDSSGECTINDVQLNLDITIRLPDWQPERPPGRALAAQWQAFSTALRHHELQHRAYAIDAAEAIRDGLAELPATPCDDIEARARQATTAIMTRMSENNRAYDVRTEHGRSEGAYWMAR